MKLLFCPNCSDMFKLRLEEMRTCSCGKTKGRYINNVDAEVSRLGISVAIGNGSFLAAVAESRLLEEITKGKASREEYYKEGNGKIEYAWVRPNSGNGNPHCKIINE